MFNARLAGLHTVLRSNDCCSGGLCMIQRLVLLAPDPRARLHWGKLGVKDASKHCCGLRPGSEATPRTDSRMIVRWCALLLMLVPLPLLLLLTLLLLLQTLVLTPLHPAAVTASVSGLCCVYTTYQHAEGLRFEGSIADTPMPTCRASLPWTSSTACFRRRTRRISSRPEPAGSMYALFMLSVRALRHALTCQQCCALQSCAVVIEVPAASIIHGALVVYQLLSTSQRALLLTYQVPGLLFLIETQSTGIWSCTAQPMLPLTMQPEPAAFAGPHAVICLAGVQAAALQRLRPRLCRGVRKPAPERRPDSCVSGSTAWHQRAGDLLRAL